MPLRSWARKNLGYRPFLILLGLGVVIRIAAMALYFPAIFQTPDSVRFARVPTPAIFSDPWMPPGYAIVLRGIREVIPALWFTIGLQHLVGLAIGVLLYLVMRRVGAKPWLACVPAGVAFLSGDFVWMEHQLMTETMMTALLTGGLFCGVHGLVPRVHLRWLAASSVLLMAAALTRSIALLAIPVLVLCSAFYVSGSLRDCLRAVAVAAVPAAVVFGLFFTVFEVSGGQYLGMSDMGGWDLYARAGPFADCSKFTPPEGTAQLCESTPTGSRDGPFGYQWDPAAAAPKLIGISPETSSLVGSFAREAILHQPLSYLKEVALESARYVAPGVDDERPWSGVPGGLQATGLFEVVNPTTNEYVESELARVYTGTDGHDGGRFVLAAYQSIFRLGGAAIGLLALLTIAGMFVARGAIRLTIFLFGVTAFLLYLVPVATVAYEVRYGLPPQPLLVVAGVLGFAALLTRRWPTAFFEPGSPDRLS